MYNIHMCIYAYKYCTIYTCMHVYICACLYTYECVLFTRVSRNLFIVPCIPSHVHRATGMTSYYVTIIQCIVYSVYSIQCI